MIAADNASVQDFASVSQHKNITDNLPVTGHVRIEKTRLDGSTELICDGVNALTNGGRDWLIAQGYTNTSAGTRGGNFLAVSNNATDTAVTDTTLVGEVTGSGLGRVNLGTASTASISHTTGTNTVVLTNTFTATGTVSDIHKAGLFNAGSAGILVHNFTFSSDVSLLPDEQLTVTWTVTLG